MSQGCAKQSEENDGLEQQLKDAQYTRTGDDDDGGDDGDEDIVQSPRTSTSLWLAIKNTNTNTVTKTNIDQSPRTNTRLWLENFKPKSLKDISRRREPRMCR